MQTASIPVLANLPNGNRFKTVPVTDDGFEPQLRCGEFAIVDTEIREPERDVFVLVKGANPGSTYSAIVQLYNPDRRRFGTPPGEPERTGPLWGTSFGLRAMCGIDGRVIRQIKMCDGPMEDELIREMIVGRVVGVLRQI